MHQDRGISLFPLPLTLRVIIANAIRLRQKCDLLPQWPQWRCWHPKGCDKRCDVPRQWPGGQPKARAEKCDVPPQWLRGQPKARAEKCDVLPQCHRPQSAPKGEDHLMRSAEPVNSMGTILSTAGRLAHLKVLWMNGGWSKGSWIGAGSFGTVYEAITEDGLYFAVKEVDLKDQWDKGQTAMKQLQQEINLLRKLKHRNIVSYWGSKQDDAKLYIFLELCKESLRQIYMRFELTHEHVRSYTKQIVDGLKYLHDQGIIHRDIKCANILSERGVLKLADFGVAKVVDKFKGTGTQGVGSVHWMAPEVVKGNNLYNHKADIWSLGCTVLEMAAGRLPYGDFENATVIYKLGHGDLPPIPDYLGEDLKDFISTCLKVNAQERPTCDDLLAHPFIA